MKLKAAKEIAIKIRLVTLVIFCSIDLSAQKSIPARPASMAALEVSHLSDHYAKILKKTSVLPKKRIKIKNQGKFIKYPLVEAMD